MFSGSITRDLLQGFGRATLTLSVLTAHLLILCFQALQKLASQYLKRDWPGINPDDQRTDYR